MHLISRHYDSFIAPCGISLKQYLLLSGAMNFGPIRPGDLARALDIDASTLTRAIKPLVDSGLLTKELGADRRSRLLNITVAGREKLTSASACWERAQMALNSILGAPRINALHIALGEAIQALRSETCRAEPSPGGA
jgi:DNA-binding MarR family transcriptional regulator